MIGLRRGVKKLIQRRGKAITIQRKAETDPTDGGVGTITWTEIKTDIKGLITNTKIFNPDPTEIAVEKNALFLESSYDVQEDDRIVEGSNNWRVMSALERIDGIFRCGIEEDKR